MILLLFYSVETVTDIQLKTKGSGGEITWKISETCFSDRTYFSYSEYSQTCNLTPGEYTLRCMDSYGDGWDGAVFEINGKKYCESFTSGRSMIVSITLGIVMSLVHSFCQFIYLSTCRYIYIRYHFCDLSLANIIFIHKKFVLLDRCNSWSMATR